MDAFAGAIGVSDSHGKCSPEYVICEPAVSELDANYFAKLLRVLALRGMFIALCPSVRERAPRVRYSDFGKFALPRPPLEEQQQILAHLDKATSRLDPALGRLKRQVALLAEHRDRLVADVATGKLDVREAAARLRDEAPLEAIEEDADLAGEPETADEEASV
jgi:type I restriction enzyme S subunit